jgi:hypothetical protein
MADNEKGAGDHSDYTPDFELPYRDVVHEDNWSEFEAKGLEPIGDDIESRADAMRKIFGTHHVYTGDAWDEDAGRPLGNKPGGSVYVSAEGRKHAVETSRRQKIEYERRLQAQSTDDPAAS